MGWSVGGRLGGWVGGWVGGWRSFRLWASVFVPVGDEAVTVFDTTALFCPLRCITGLLWRVLEHETTHPFASVLL